MLIEKNDVEMDELELPGDRLTKILDKAGFKKGRGRSAELYDFLVENCSEGMDLKAATVRSWFAKNSPPMKKIISIIETIEKHYGFKTGVDLKAIEAWWKIGGNNPFPEEDSPAKGESPTEKARKLEFLLPSIILDQVGEDFGNLSSSDLERIKDFTKEFILAFGDPAIKTCPDEYLRMAISYMHNMIKRDQ